MDSLVQQVAVWAVPVLAAVILHEIAHGYVAYSLGDTTAQRAGRLTLNPIAHIDPVGTVLLPMLLIATKAPFLFGWAKPVPVNWLNLRHPKRDMVWVALAGPATNILLAIASTVVFRAVLGLPLPADGSVAPALVAVLTPIMLMLQNSIVVNVVLAVFNLLPILPLDGGRVLAGLLPRRQALAFAQLERFGMVIVMVLLATNVLGQIVGPVVHLFLRVLL